MITDRTQNDVDTAALLRLKMLSGIELSEAEKELFLRGSCTNEMLNRIESKIYDLSELLKSAGYANSCVAYSDNHWDSDSIFENSDYNRLFDNLKELKKTFYVLETTPATPTYLYGWKESNDIEKILVDIESLITIMKKNYKKCGTFQCGGDTL